MPGWWSEMATDENGAPWAEETTNATKGDAYSGAETGPRSGSDGENVGRKVGTAHKDALDNAADALSSFIPPHGADWKPEKARISAKVKAQAQAEAEARKAGVGLVRGKALLRSAVEESRVSLASSRSVSFRMPDAGWEDEDKFEDEEMGGIVGGGSGRLDPGGDNFDSNFAQAGHTFSRKRLSSVTYSAGDLLSDADEGAEAEITNPPGIRNSLTASTRRSRRSSLTMRKVPEHILLGPCENDSNAADSDEENSSSLRGVDRASPKGSNGNKEVPGFCGFLHRTCLRPTLPLRTQMMLSFGLVSALTVLLVVIVSVVISTSSGDAVRSVSKDSLQYWARDKASSSARYVSDALAPIISSDVVAIMYEAARDRFVGYPDHPGYEDDVHVPFMDMDSGRNIYPLDAPLNKLDWDMGTAGNVKATNAREHVGDRYPWYAVVGSKLSTETAMYHMQGACDPSVETQSQDPRTYLEGCSDAHNNITKGGIISPTTTNEGLFLKSKDLTPLFKALYESDPSIKEMGLFFANSGAGSSYFYPHFPIDYTVNYTSIGCEWMNEPNPYDPSQPIGTQEEIDRCQPKGTEVNNVRYNVLERGWCREQALDPHKVKYVGPFLSAWAEKEWLMLIGRGVYDKLTNKFLGCLFVDIIVDHIPEILNTVKIGEGSSNTLVRWDDGTVVASPGWDHNAATETTTVNDPALDVGVDSEAFESLKSKVDFEGIWDPAEVRETYETFVIATDGKIVSSYPVPPPPDEFDPKYYPDFMVIVTLEEDYVFQSIYDLDARVKKEVLELIMFALVVGFGGLAFVICIIWLVSVNLTKPLNWMNDAADLIANKFGSEFQLGSELEKEEVFRFSPHTELADVIKEFKKLVSRFSGEGTAKAVRFGSKITEVKNRFTMLDEFEWLYQSRKGAGFKFNYDMTSTSDISPSLREMESNSTKMEEKGEVGSVIPAADVPRRLHFGHNIHNDIDSKLVSVVPSQKNSALKSPLFRWIVGLIVLPLVIITVTITAVVTWRINTYFTEVDEVVRTEYLELEKNAMTQSTMLRTIQAAQVTTRAVRDLHVHTRVAGWLLFGGLGRSMSFTEMHTNAEECKYFPNEECPLEAEAVCDCVWNDQLMGEKLCRRYTEDTRYNQSLFFEGQRRYTWPNGDLNETRPNGEGNSTADFVETSPELTAFWGNISSVPGHEKGASAGGHESTYDRLRVISATAAIQFPLYNYDVSDDKNLGTYFGFEADGSFTGYSGCSHFHSYRPHFQSTEENGAARMNPILCPLGKYGYDSRCRDWYVTGKKHGMNLTSAPLYVTPPYLYAGIDVTAQSAALPMIDPKTSELVGISLIDFVPNVIASALKKENTNLVDGGFPILITAEPDVLGHDTVIGPGFVMGDEGRRIEELVLLHDEVCSPGDDCGGFHEIANAMRRGESGSASFETGPDGLMETVHISYAPVEVKSFRPVDESDFSRGITEFTSLIYSLALAQPEDELLKPFQDVAGDVQKQVNIAIGVLSALITVATIFLLYISYRVTVSITVPITQLLSLLRNMNQLENKEDFLPPEDGSESKEVLAVYETFSMLFKVIRFANSAFFSGDIEKAYLVFVDALRLFKGLDNKKAIGVASNNLGNCMLTMYRKLEAMNRTHICGLCRENIIQKGTTYFRDAIKLGEEAYDKFYEEQGWSGSCLVFMQHLSNRYFNRAIFLLTVRKDHRWPEEAKRLGFRDLDIAKNMDEEIADQCLEVGFAIDKAEWFDLMLSRIRGLLTLEEMGYPDEWDIGELIENTYKELKTALKCPLESDFFREVSPAGRMQQLDTEMIKHAVLEGRKEDAARIGIRMLIEDEYAFHEAESNAVKALVDYIQSEGSKHPEVSTQVRDDLIHYQAGFESHFTETVSRRVLQNQKSVEVPKALLSHQSKRMVRCDTGLTKSSAVSLKMSAKGDFTMEVF